MNSGIHPAPKEFSEAQIAAIIAQHYAPVIAENERLRAENYKTFTDGMEAAAQICGSLAETTYDDTDAFEAATGCEAEIMKVVKQQRKEQALAAKQQKLCDFIADPILRFFHYSHLPATLQQASKPFCDLAGHIVETLPRNPERTVALRKLLEAKDAAVRANID